MSTAFQKWKKSKTTKEEKGVWRRRMEEEEGEEGREKLRGWLNISRLRTTWFRTMFLSDWRKRKARSKTSSFRTDLRIFQYVVKCYNVNVLSSFYRSFHLISFQPIVPWLIGSSHFFSLYLNSSHLLLCQPSWSSFVSSLIIFHFISSVINKQRKLPL